MKIILILGLLVPQLVIASSATTSSIHDLSTTWYGYLCLMLFIIAYLIVVFEEKLHLKKSKPVLIAAGLIWITIAIAMKNSGIEETVEISIRHNFLEYTELFFFLLVAMTYINAIAERGVFKWLRDWLIYKGLSYKQLFWITGILAFFISPIADNLTTALIMCAIILAIGKGNSKFISISCINIVIAANAGGAFSPFGDITTLMVWQKGMVEFKDFFKIFLPSVVNYIVPALIMSFSISHDKPVLKKKKKYGKLHKVKYGGSVVVILFLATIVTAVTFHSVLNLPPVFGMMFGLGYLKMFSFFLNKRINNDYFNTKVLKEHISTNFDVFDKIAKSEWDTLFFFYGVILSVGGLSYLGYLAHTSEFFYGNYGATTANIVIGMLSSIIDNIPIMFAVLTMNPEMSDFQWLLITLTVGVGGSLLSIGSAAGVALMGQAKGHYTFFSHLKWTPVIALGYFASIAVHFLINNIA
ncbi:MAG: sodium:proton antiporter NhaD [Marinicellaceae bacterium]